MKEIKLKKPVEEFTPSEVRNALETVESCRSLVYGVMGAGLCTMLSPPATTDVTIWSDKLESYKAGWSDGMEALLKKFPDDVDSFSLKEILEAVYGGVE